MTIRLHTIFRGFLAFTIVGVLAVWVVNEAYATGVSWDLPQQVGKEVVVAEEKIDVADMLPANSAYYYYK